MRQHGTAPLHPSACSRGTTFPPPLDKKGGRDEDAETGKHDAASVWAEESTPTSTAPHLLLRQAWRVPAMQAQEPTKFSVVPFLK